MVNARNEDCMCSIFHQEVRKQADKDEATMGVFLDARTPLCLAFISSDTYQQSLSSLP